MVCNSYRWFYFVYLFSCDYIDRALTTLWNGSKWVWEIFRTKHISIALIWCCSDRHEAERLEQEAKGRLERQKIVDEAEAEKARKELLELQAYSAAVESTGQAKAEAQSRAEAQKIDGEAAVEQARLKSEAAKIEAVSLSVILRSDLALTSY